MQLLSILSSLVLLNCSSSLDLVAITFTLFKATPRLLLYLTHFSNSLNFPFVFEEPHHAAFTALKSALASAPVL